MSLTYVTRVLEGSIHTPFVAIAVGTAIVTLECTSLRRFIRVANEKGIYEVLENQPPGVREILAFVYEEFGDET